MPSRPPSHKPSRGRGKQFDPSLRNTRATRTYPTSHPVWRRIRDAVLAREPLCRACAGEGKVTPANEVDHINGDATDNRSENLQPLCKPCHSRKTRAEMNRATQG